MSIKALLKTVILKHDWFLTLLLVVISGLGLLALYSASLSVGKGTLTIFYKQIVWFCLAIFVYFIVSSIDYKKFIQSAFILYSGLVFFLLLVLILGHVAMGAERWITVGPFRFQPSEFGKVIMVIFLAGWFSKNEVMTFKDIIVSFFWVVVPALLILLEPDLGTAVVYGFIYIFMLFVSGVPVRLFLHFMGLVFSFIPIAWFFVLKDYQKKRILIFIDPYIDPLGAGYNVIQARIAVGSGGFWGKGFLKGTQSKLRFLPEPHTDFIFGVFAEEFGFIGGITLIILFGLVFFRLLYMADRVSDMSGKLIIVGVLSFVLFQVVENMAMAMGLAPVTGIPLPFFSYGGSSLLTLAFAFGLCQSVLIHSGGR